MIKKTETKTEEVSSKPLKTCQRCGKQLVQTDMYQRDANGDYFHMTCADISLAEWVEMNNRQKYQSWDFCKSINCNALIRTKEMRKQLICPSCEAYQMHQYLKERDLIFEEVGELINLNTSEVKEGD